MKKYTASFLVACLIFCGCAQGSSTISNSEIQLDTALPLQRLPWETICGQSKNAVIQIRTIAQEPNILEPFRSATQASWTGSGFFISDDGYIISNFHVVDKQELCFMQHPALSKERFLLDVIGSCPEKDFALLKLNDADCEKIKKLLKVSQLPYLPLGDSHKLVEGEEIMVLGYPLGTENFKSSKGIVSGRESTFIGECIQTTAAVNHGNSGGPVVDNTGAVIGISTMGPSKDEAEGIAYLIAINDVITLLPQLKNGNILRLPFWGFEHTPTTEFELQRWHVPTDGGVYLKKVYKNSLFAAAGLQQGDILYSINNSLVDRFGFMNVSYKTDKSSIIDYLNSLAIGATATITAYRDGTAHEFSIFVQDCTPFKISTIYTPYEELPPYEVIGGLVVSELSVNHLHALAYKYYLNPADECARIMLRYANPDNRHENRLVISSVLPNSQADQTRCFDYSLDLIISTVNNTPVKTIDDFRNAVRKSIGQPSLVIKTEGGSFIELPIKDIVNEEEDLRDRNEYYPRSSLIDELEEGLTEN